MKVKPTISIFSQSNLKQGKFASVVHLDSGFLKNLMYSTDEKKILFLEQALNFYNFAYVNPTDWNTDLVQALKKSSSLKNFYSVFKEDLEVIKDNIEMGGWILVLGNKPVQFEATPSDWFDEDQLFKFFQTNELELLVSSFYDDNHWIIITR